MLRHFSTMASSCAAVAVMTEGLQVEQLRGEAAGCRTTKKLKRSYSEKHTRHTHTGAGLEAVSGPRRKVVLRE